MISLAIEEVLTVQAATSHLPPRANGQRVHVSTVYRWIARGIRGVVLESLRVGGTTYTSVQAIQRFAERVTESAARTSPRVEISGSRARAIDRATRAVRLRLKLDAS